MPPDGTVNIAQSPEELRAQVNVQVDSLREMAEITGVDHVSIGTDQHVSPGACRITRNGFTSSRRSCAVTPEEAGKIAGGNYMRIFRDAVG